ncbi:aspartate ammonia-lyase [Leptospira levettii]|uniref:aspartate ammonia-lyase n=1 Tax=Leptospira levettii TaxID=2023178 RepID=UPI000C2AC4EA|nr:aspartate ammonia-lyase [Leptospira levettii]PKA28147.1 aspartate ammonia-lyase [Leptospira sp. mixed culture ATI2-C-A1]TGM26383.1 aspartate ammonia-lyase [Leptospira levettii]
MTETNFRMEHDLLGEREIPKDVYWGIHTLRALENYPITGKSIGTYPDLVCALAHIKKASALANFQLGLLPSEKSKWIVEACDQILKGKFHSEFVVDVIQGGAGTSTNMNANEVITNIALELAGHSKGDYTLIHPLNDVNMSQSTNDVYPSSIKLAAVFSIIGLLSALESLQVSFRKKSNEFKDILKIGRTQLQDAVPMTLGQEFSTYDVMLGEDISRLKEATSLIGEINLGATAIGTGINTDIRYSKIVTEILAKQTGFDLNAAPNLIEATQDTGAFVQLSGVLKRIATKLSKVCNDLRLLSSGPQGGFNEINLPAKAAGSSIMPGKVNPIIPEVVNQIAFEVIGNDITITMAAEAGQLQLNAFEPIIAHSLFKSIEHLTAGCKTLETNCVSGITANQKILESRVKTSAGLATALNPYIGYENATLVAKRALAENRSVESIVLELGFLEEKKLKEILRPEVLTSPHSL